MSAEPPVVRPEAIIDGLLRSARILESLPIGRWRSFDSEIRRRSIAAPDWFPDMWRASPSLTTECADAAGHDRDLVLAILAMHPSGYVRQPALERLVLEDLPSAPVVAVLRCTDWVGVVRESAARHLDGIRDANRIDLLLPSLSLMEEPGGSVRARGSYLDGLRQWTVQNAGLDSLTKAVAGPDIRLRQASARALIERGESAAAFAAAANQDDPATAATVARGLSPADWEDRATIDVALGAPFVGLRSLGFFHLQALDSAAAEAIARDSLFDRSNTMRNLSQRFLAHRGIDVAELYRAAMGSNGVRAIVGLGEVGNKGDVEQISSYVQAEDPAMRVAAIRSTAALDGRGSEPLLTTLTCSADEADARAASRELARLGPGLDSVELIWASLAGRHADHAIPTAFRVFRVTSRWPRLVIALRSIAGGGEHLVSAGYDLLHQGLQAWNRSALDPSIEQRAELRDLMSRVQGMLGRDQWELLSTSVKPYLPANER